jgi:hypothetical protein
MTEVAEIEALQLQMEEMCAQLNALRIGKATDHI